MHPSHLDAIRRIEHAAHSHPWAESHLSDIERRLGRNQVLLVNGQVVGYFYAQLVAGEGTLLNLAVDPAMQGKGYGRALMNQLLALLEQEQAESLWLEVRASNTPAIALYDSCGFNEINRRVDYYPTADGREDAVIMVAYLAQGDDEDDLSFAELLG
ncbi:[Ribosomal protein S18]-alanine N-acetyltransferase [Vibrio stylophorae]|uniref:[Ribosomal protein bS18]-alanine N-acetyltransferase n=2 Tax=Vibrio stylophorae TaxID=659351 RepID=A0ABM8ZSB5_9VIBR|nr:[Ribosomal protein S18]-alanine N-acetyltransferase [Vibrio stylophorae]